MRMTTMHGKRMTTPRGTDMLELPFNLSGRLKKANLDAIMPALDLRPFSSDGSWAAGVGAIFDTRRRRSMMDWRRCRRSLELRPRLLGRFDGLCLKIIISRQEGEIRG